MNEALAAAEPGNVADRFKRRLSEFAFQHVDQWLDVAVKFLKLHGQHCVDREPPAEILGEFDEALLLLRRSGLMMEFTMRDFPDRDRVNRVSAVTWNLNEAWRLTHPTMSAEESDAILKQIFPDESRA